MKFVEIAFFCELPVSVVKIDFLSTFCSFITQACIEQPQIVTTNVEILLSNCQNLSKIFLQIA
jgi:hypothetical protein